MNSVEWNTGVQKSTNIENYSHLLQFFFCSKNKKKKRSKDKNKEKDRDADQEESPPEVEENGHGHHAPEHNHQAKMGMFFIPGEEPAEVMKEIPEELEEADESKV